VTSYLLADFVAARETAAGMIEATRLARRYGRRWALTDVTFKVPSGSVLMVAGRNGAGKSTLFRVLATAIKPDRGTAVVGGFDVLRAREDVRRVTAILAHHNYLYDALTARENLEVVAAHLGMDRRRVGEILDRVGLAARENDAVSTFSAGMRKRLSFARILLQEPKIVLLDEPYGALDPPGFDLVDSVIEELKRGGATVLMATHQWERSASLAESALVLDQGRVIWQGPASEALAHEPHDITPRGREGAC
jgi:heme ABC exporter ATP-binding subunit CcmA